MIVAVEVSAGEEHEGQRLGVQLQRAQANTGKRIERVTAPSTPHHPHFSNSPTGPIFACRGRT